jgi:hypothetical protein
VIGKINTLNHLGDSYLIMGDYENTIGAYGTAMRLAKMNFYRPDQLRAIDGLVTAHSAVARYERCFELLEQRLVIAKFLNSPNEELKYFVSSGQYI